MPRFRVLVAVGKDESVVQLSSSDRMYRTFIRTLLQLAVMRGLLDKIEDGLREGCISDGPSFPVSVVLPTSLRILTGRDLFRHDVVYW